MEPEKLIYWEQRFTSYLHTHLVQDDGSHDLSHFQRVWSTARHINRAEGMPADPLILLTSAYFHDLVSLPKNHPDRKLSSRLSAEQTAQILEREMDGFPAEKIPGIYHAIHAHSFSAGVPANTIEARILQDADRMEAIGAIGLARVFYTAGQLSQKLFDPVDPMAERRPLDDGRFSLDHFKVKLLKLPAMMNTATGKKMAEANAAYLVEFLHKIKDEIQGNWD